ncbi:MAG TPA: succinylglutamate desuccinylase/aspartoacylase family protein [Myxococcota bacterium]|nr:succinylglutamate desuccinylase/aspartoacylase family protein [Myxococcota bacterium]
MPEPPDSASGRRGGDRPAGGRRARGGPPARPRLRFSRLPVLDGADLTTRRLALLEARSGRPGPLVWLTAGIHGDEVGGIVVVQELFRRLRRRPLLAGRLAAFPLLNPFGFDAASRRIPSTEEDLNRSFPGDPAGTFAERMAHLIHSRIVGDAPALVLDLHNDWIRSIPYALIDPRPASEAGRTAYARARAAAAATGFPMVDEQVEGVSRAMLRSTLTGCLLEGGVAALTLELGGAHVVDEGHVASGLAAVWRVLADLGVVEPDADAPPAPALPGRYRGRMLRYGHRPYPSHAGIVRFRVGPGDFVRPGTPIAAVQDLFGRNVELLRAESEAIVLGHADSSIAVPGVPLVAMALLSG